MQLGHSHRQLLSRCSLRWYSAPASNGSSDAIAASGTSVPSRLKRRFASSFGGIDIQNVVVPTQSASKGFRNKTIRPFQPHSSKDKPSDGRRMGQPERNRGTGRDGASSVSGWGDGLVSLSFSSRLKLRQKGLSNTQGTGTGPRSQEGGQSWKQRSNQAQRPQMTGHRRGQGDDASQTHHRRGKTEESASAAAVQQGNRASAPITGAKNNKSRTSSMTRPSSSSTFKSTTRATPKAASASSPSSSRATATQPTTSDRKARLAVLSSTNLNALFRTNSTPTAGISLPSLPSSTTTASASVRDRVRSVLEHSAGDYSRYVGAGEKNALRLPALRKARLALATQRDVSLEQRRVALHIIGGLVQPRRGVHA